MSVSSVLKTQVFRGLYNYGKFDYNLKWFIENGNFFFLNKPSGKKFELVTNSIDDVMKSLCHDISRFSCSAIETITNINDDPEFPKSNAWMSIRAYYSAFFSAHCILRIFGRSCSYLSNDEVRSINNSLKKQYNDVRVSGGNYIIELKKQTGSIVLNSKEIDSSHAGLWGQFISLLDELLTTVSSLTSFTDSQKNECVGFIFELKQRMTRRGGSSFLSIVRNEINYNHAMYSWSSYKTNKKLENNNIKIKIESWKKECNRGLFSSNNSEKVEFIETCAIIVSLMKDLIIELYFFNKNGFLRYGTISILRKYVDI